MESDTERHRDRETDTERQEQKEEGEQEDKEIRKKSYLKGAGRASEGATTYAKKKRIALEES